jgi:hypothetical protein
MNDSFPQAYSGTTHEPATSFPQIQVVGSKDGAGAGDHDLPFAGFQAAAFSTRQMVRLLLLRSDVLDARLGQGPFAADIVSR